MKKHRFNHCSIAYLFLPLVLAGCAQQFQDSAETIKAAWDSTTDTQISAEKIKNIPYASIFLRVNDGPKVFVVLAFAEENKQTKGTLLKWLSSDQAMIVTENGRIIKTLGYNNDNLANLSIPDSITRKLTYNTISKSGNAIYDWQPNFRYGFVAKVKQKDLGYETLKTSLWQEKTHHIEETVTFPTLKTTFQNEFWVNDDNKVVKTIQYLGPNMNKLEITFIKPYQH